MGDGARLLDPMTGEFTAWSALLTEWEERAILTPVSLPAWRRREGTLAESFTLLPATLAGVAELAERYELPLADERRREDLASNVAPPDTDYDVTIKDLKDYLGPDAFQWLCACALYPELQWELTLKVGQLALPPESAARLDEALLWRLLRLPWFRKGLIPDQVRLELVRTLDVEAARRVREFLIKTLEDNSAEEGTYAADERRLDIAVQRAYLAGDDRRERKAAVEKIEHLEPGELQRDYTLLRLLEERPTSLLALVLSARLRKLFYPEGLSHYGMKWQVALALALVAALLLWGGVEDFIRYRQAHQPKSAPTPELRPTPTPVVTPTLNPILSGTPNVTQKLSVSPTVTATAVDASTMPRILTGILDKMENAHRQMKSLKAELVQQRAYPQIGITDTDYGTLIYKPASGKDKGKLRIDYTKPDVKVLSVIGENVTFYEPRLNQAIKSTVGRVAKGETGTQLMGLDGSLKVLLNNCKVEIAGDATVGGQPATILRLTLQDRDDYSSIDIWIPQNGIPVQWKMVERNGDYTVVTLKNTQMNTNIADSAFDINLPSGIKIIDNL